MRGLAMGLHALMESFGLPPWILPVAFLVLLYSAWIWIQKGSPASKARGLVKRAGFEARPERDAMEHKALELAAGHPEALLAVIQEARSRGRKDLAMEALAQLQDTGKAPYQVARLKRELLGSKTGTTTRP